MGMIVAATTPIVAVVSCSKKPNKGTEIAKNFFVFSEGTKISIDISLIDKDENQKNYADEIFEKLNAIIVKFANENIGRVVTVTIKVPSWIGISSIIDKQIHIPNKAVTASEVFSLIFNNQNENTNAPQGENPNTNAPQSETPKTDAPQTEDLGTQIGKYLFIKTEGAQITFNLPYSDVSSHDPISITTPLEQSYHAGDAIPITKMNEIIEKFTNDNKGKMITVVLKEKVTSESRTFQLPDHTINVMQFGNLMIKGENKNSENSIDQWNVRIRKYFLIEVNDTNVLISKSSLSIGENKDILNKFYGLEQKVADAYLAIFANDNKGKEVTVSVELPSWFPDKSQAGEWTVQIPNRVITDGEVEELLLRKPSTTI